MKEIEGLTEENGAVYYEHNGEKINLTEIGDECGTLHMTKAINILRDKIGGDRKLATSLMGKEYAITPPNRTKIQAQRADHLKRQEEIAECERETARLKEAKRQVKEIAAQRKAKG